MNLTRGSLHIPTLQLRAAPRSPPLPCAPAAHMVTQGFLCGRCELWACCVGGAWSLCCTPCSWSSTEYHVWCDVARARGGGVLQWRNAWVEVLRMALLLRVRRVRRARCVPVCLSCWCGAMCDVGMVRMCWRLCCRRPRCSWWKSTTRMSSALARLPRAH